MADHTHAARIARGLLDVPVHERDAALDRACAGDANLRSLVTDLIQQEARVTIDSRAAASEPRAQTPREKRIGPYTVLGMLGEGGMGVVYLAEQDKPRRTVALKVVRPGLLSARMLRRFEVESQVLARLHHPGIAQIFEAAAADTGSGPQPYYAMEYVEGATLTAHASAAKLPLRDKIVLFLKVCEAVQHAHQKGVIHRDLKPGNILVDATGQPKVVDFGIARLTDDRTQVTEQTEVGQILGTLAYMSPEQVSGGAHAVDTRSDVYSLGVILYELLSGRLPHPVTGKSVPEAMRSICEGVPEALSSTDRQLRGDLQTIVAKAMEKDKSRRYATASELEADLKRFLDDEPILARPPSSVYLIRKFASRNRALVTGAALAVLALVGGAAATAWQAVEATRGRELARKAAIDAKTEAENAKAVTGFLSRMLSAANPELGGDREVTMREMVDRAAEELSAAPIENTKVDMTVRDLLANTYRSIGHSKEAEPFSRLIASRAEEIYGADSIEAYEARRSLAIVLGELGRFEEAEPIQRAAMDWLISKFGPDNVDAARCRGELGTVVFQRGRYAEAEDLIRESLRIIRPALGEGHKDVMTNLDHLGSALNQLGRFEEAEKQLREVLAIRERVYGPEHTMVGFSLNNLANAVQKQGRNEEAVQILERALSIRRKNLDPDHPSVLVSIQNLAVAKVGLGLNEEAEKLLRESVRLQTAKLGLQHPKTLIAMSNLAFACQNLKKLDEAEELYKTIVEARKRSAGEDPQAWVDMNNLAMLVQVRGRIDEAEKLYAEILTLSKGKLPEGHYIPAIILNNQGECLTVLKRYDEAEQALLESHAALEKFYKAGHPRVNKSLGRLASLYDAWGKPEKAVEYRAKVAAK